MNTMNGIMVANFDGANPTQANFWIFSRRRRAAEQQAEEARQQASDAQQRADEAALRQQQQIEEHNRQMRELMEKQRQMVNVVAPVREKALAIAGSTQNLVIIGIICAVAIWYFFIRKKK